MTTYLNFFRFTPVCHLHGIFFDKPLQSGKTATMHTFFDYGEECPVTRDEQGITTISIFDFLLKENSLEL